MVKICKCIYLHLSITHFYHFVMVTLKTRFWPFRFYQKLWETSTGLFKNAKKQWKKRNGQIISTFLPYILWPKLLKTVEMCRCCTSPLILHISTVQLLNCRNLKEEQNCSYNGGGVVHLQQSGDIHFNLTVRDRE